jgi:hypothetical protein
MLRKVFLVSEQETKDRLVPDITISIIVAARRERSHIIQKPSGGRA